MKQCTKCKQFKDFELFPKEKTMKDGCSSHCKKCKVLQSNEYYYKNLEKCKENKKQFYDKNKEIIKKKRNLTPWVQTYRNIKLRCLNKKSKQYKDYGGRGIECKITVEELKFLWFRDKAYEMDKPSIDRKENNGNYELGNCQYIELQKNVSKQDKSKFKVQILQHDLNKKLIKEWESIMSASKVLKIVRANIIKCLKHTRNHAGGFIWTYKPLEVRE